MRFEFATATRIVFGPGAARDIAPLAAGFGRRAFVVADGDGARAAAVLAELQAQGLATDWIGVAAEPTTDSALAATARAREFGADIAIGLGGGSALDTGKAVAALLANPGDLLDYLEVVGRGRALAHPSIPYIAAPTTAGPGAEVTRNAVLASPEHRVKVSLRSLHMLPRVAVVDPELTYSLPPAVTASTGLDALTQLIEPYTCISPNPMTDALCREGMARAARSLRRAYEDGRDAAAREDMAITSLFGGLALANAKLGAVHGLAGPLGGLFPAPHGAVCARLLPIVMAANVRALQARAPASPALARYAEVAEILTGRPGATIEDGIAWVSALCADLAVPPLSTYGMTQDDIPVVVAQGQKASSMKGNPIALTDEELAGILAEA